MIGPAAFGRQGGGREAKAGKFKAAPHFMFVYILRRLSQTALVLAITSLLVFGGLYLVGDPVEILVNPRRTRSRRSAPRPRSASTSRSSSSTWTFVKGAFDRRPRQVLRLRAPALEVIFERMPATLELAFLAMLIAVVLGIPLGLYAGLRPRVRSSSRRSWPARSSASRCRPSGSA